MKISLKNQHLLPIMAVGVSVAMIFASISVSCHKVQKELSMGRVVRISELVLPEIAQVVPEEQVVGDLFNLNTATKEELMRLDGIGEVKAEAILEYRKQNGAFTTVEELLEVKGIGEKTYEKIKQYVLIE